MSSGAEQYQVKVVNIRMVGRKRYVRSFDHRDDAVDFIRQSEHRANLMIQMPGTLLLERV